MHRRAILVSLVALASSAISVRPAAAAPALDTPAATIESLQQGLIAAATQPDASLEQRYRTLEPLIVATHDLVYIAEFALRRQWGTLTEDERQRFVAAFQRLSVMTYASRFKAVGADTFRAISQQPPDASGRVQVTTAVARADQADVSLEYLLAESDQGWRIINVVADGVSDLALKRAEYQRLFAAGGIDGLIAELEQQAERLARG